MRRTPTIEHRDGEDFAVLGTVTKHWSDDKTGQRFLRGVVSDVAEDADGERVSARAIAKMAAKALGGGRVLATASHDQEWWNEFGDVVALKHHPEHNELSVDVKLPPKGEDPIADKAFVRAQRGDLGWSIGGKLVKSYFEVVPSEVGKGGKARRRHVLDEIDLRHVMLTKKPSNRRSFAQAVAKTAKLDEAPTFGDEDLFDEDDAAEQTDAATILKRAAADLEARVAKAKTAPSPDEDASAEPESAAADADPDHDPDVPTPGAGDTSPGERTDAQAAQDLPQGKGQRHLACPNCGTEFAAPLPDDLKPGDVATKDDDEDTSSADDTTAKTTNKETPMAPAPLNDTLAQIRALATGGAQVAKTDPEEIVTTVAKDTREEEATAPEATDVERLIAAGARMAIEKTEELGEAMLQAVGDLTTTVRKQQEIIDGMPLGRRSTARGGGRGVQAPVVKTTTGEDLETVEVFKVSTDTTPSELLALDQEQLLQLSHEQIAKCVPDGESGSLMKILNKRDRGVF